MPHQHMPRKPLWKILIHQDMFGKRLSALLSNNIWNNTNDHYDNQLKQMFLTS